MNKTSNKIHKINMLFIKITQTMQIYRIYSKDTWVWNDLIRKFLHIIYVLKRFEVFMALGFTRRLLTRIFMEIWVRNFLKKKIAKYQVDESRKYWIKYRICQFSSIKEENKYISDSMSLLRYEGCFYSQVTCGLEWDRKKLQSLSKLFNI